MTDMTTVLTCDKCGLAYRASLLPHECAEWTKGRNEQHKGDVMERREWYVGSRSNHEATIREGGALVGRVDVCFADMIVNDHNQHATLTEQRDRLAAVLRQVREACNHRSLEMIGRQVMTQISAIDSVLATVEQGGGES